MTVRIDLYSEAHLGAYAVAVTARPPHLARPADLPGRSADVVTDNRPAKTGATSLVLEPAVPSPVAGEALRRLGRLVQAYLYHPRDEAEILAFDARITAEYSAFYATRGIFYMGTFHVTGPDGPCIGEILTYDATSQEEADRLGNDDLPAAIVAIEDECRLLQDTTRPRYLIWLTPQPSTA